MPYTADGFEWEYPAHVVAAIDGRSFVADIDLGFHLTVRAVVIDEDLLIVEEVKARKEAQRLLQHADVFLRVQRIVSRSVGGRQAVVAEVMYSPFHVARSEQASFKAAMLASGYAVKAA